MKKGKTEFEQWVMYAENDLKAAQELLNSKLYNIVCFHSQQAIEKYLKAFLVYNGVNPPRTHSIVYLIEMCASIEEDFEKFKEEARIIDVFYIPSRYPNAPLGSLPDSLPNKDDAERAFEIAQKICQFVKNLLPN